MKTRLMIAAALLIMSVSTARAQFIRGIGIKVGTVAANQTWDYSSFGDLSTTTRYGFTIGGFIEMFSFSHFSLLGEVQYTQKGMEYTVPVTTTSSPDGIGSMSVSPRVDYISIPILAKLRITTPIVEPYVIAGPRFDILVSKVAEGMGAVIDKFKDTDYGITVGVGAELGSLIPLPLLVEARYNASPGEAFDNSLVKVKNRSFDILVGIRF